MFAHYFFQFALDLPFFWSNLVQKSGRYQTYLKKIAKKITASPGSDKNFSHTIFTSTSEAILERKEHLRNFEKNIFWMNN